MTTRSIRLRPIRPSPRDLGFITDSRLRGTIVRMISLNSLDAFAQEIIRRPAIGPAETASPVRPASRATPASDGVTQQRTLEAAPTGPAPARPLPRGTLLDLRV
jgi:hypothetical protein